MCHLSQFQLHDTCELWLYVAYVTNDEYVRHSLDRSSSSTSRRYSMRTWSDMKFGWEFGNLLDKACTLAISDVFNDPLWPISSLGPLTSPLQHAEY